MIRASFDIGSTDGTDKNQSLLLEVGERILTYLSFTGDRKQLLSVRQFHIDLNPEKPVSEYLYEIFAQDGETSEHHFPATIIYNFPESNLVPESAFDMELIRPLTSLVYGNSAKGLILSEKVENWELYNVFRIPGMVHSMVQNRYTAGRYWHIYSLLLKSSAARNLPGIYGNVIFYPDRFIIGLFREGKLLLVNTFLFQTPEDAAYYLLALCQQHELDPKTIIFEISGSVDEQSALYAELKKYFLEVNFGTIPSEIETSGLLQEYPGHYFSHLLKMALCV